MIHSPLPSLCKKYEYPILDFNLFNGEFSSSSFEWGCQPRLSQVATIQFLFVNNCVLVVHNSTAELSTDLERLA